MENTKAINLAKKLNLFSEHWSPRTIASANGQEFKLAKLKGDFVWHHHDHSDEVFLVVKGQLDIELQDGCIHLKEGDMAVIPKGVEHRPRAKEECAVLLMDKIGTVNTGQSGGPLTAPINQKI